MTTLPASARAPRSLARNDLFLPALLGLIVLAMAALAAAVLAGAESLPAVRWLALIALLAAAYDRHGYRLAAMVIAFFTSALLPAALIAWDTPGFTPTLLDILAYAILLGVVGYLAATAAAFLRARQTLSGAVRDWEALLARTAEPEEVAAFVLQQATAIAGAQRAVLLLRNPVDGQWEALDLTGGGHVRVPEVEPRKNFTLARWLIEQRRPLIIENVAADLRMYAPPTGAGRTIRSLLAQPLTGQDGSLLAVVVLINKLKGVFDQADFAALADLLQAGQQALEQAGQHARTDHALTRRVQQLAALQRTAHALNTTMDPQAIVDETLACALSLTGAEVGLVSVDLPGVGPVYRTSNVQVASDILDRAADLVPELQQALLIQAGDDSVYSLLPQSGLRLVAPIRRAGNNFGLILVESSRPAAFGQEARRSIASLADHAAVALDNTRLFNEIRREKHKSDEIIAAVAEALFTVGPTGHVTTFNPAAEALTGWRAEEAVGHLVCDVLNCARSDNCQPTCRLLGALTQVQHVRDTEMVIRQRLGTQRVVTLDATPLPASGNHDQEGGLVVLLRDVTEAREMERMQRELITGFSHELRTPLTIIQAATDMLMAHMQAQNGVGETEAMLVETLQAQAQRLTNFADRIASLRRSEDPAELVKPEPLPLAARLAQMVSPWQRSLSDRAIRVSQPPGEVWVWADEQALNAVLDALIDNAIKYAPPGCPIDLSIVLDPPGYATVAVCDQGPGIAPQHQARVFDRFYRVDAGDAQRVYGQGLGLYLARNLVTQMGGQIWVESEVGRGSRFAFTLALVEEGPNEDPGD